MLAQLVLAENWSSALVLPTLAILEPFTSQVVRLREVAAELCESASEVVRVGKQARS